MGGARMAEGMRRRGVRRIACRERTDATCTTRCKPCHNLKSFLRKLEFGESKGKKCCKATDEEIENCIRNYPARKDYKCPSGITDIWGIYVCWTWAKEALQACCLTCGSKYKTSAD